VKYGVNSRQLRTVRRSDKRIEALVRWRGGFEPSRTAPEPWVVVREGERPEEEPSATSFVHLHTARPAAA
jgi:hypothetical protein